VSIERAPAHDQNDDNKLREPQRFTPYDSDFYILFA